MTENNQRPRDSASLHSSFITFSVVSHDLVARCDFLELQPRLQPASLDSRDQDTRLNRRIAVGSAFSSRTMSSDLSEICTRTPELYLRIPLSTKSSVSLRRGGGCLSVGSFSLSSHENLILTYGLIA